MRNQQRVIEGGRFDEPLVMDGAIANEPQRYIAEKPYDLTKFEFSILRRQPESQFWLNLVAGATAGIVIAIAGKALAALLEKEVPTLEAWEFWAVVLGTVTSVAIKFIPMKDSKERKQLEEVIDGHFSENKPRRLHLTKIKEQR